MDRYIRSGSKTIVMGTVNWYRAEAGVIKRGGYARFEGVGDAGHMDSPLFC